MSGMSCPTSGSVASSARAGMRRLCPCLRRRAPFWSSTCGPRERAPRRMSGKCVWEIVKDLERRVGVPELHPHALRHACGAEFLRRTHGNLRIVQEHLRHRDVQTTTVYTKITQEDLQQQLRVFDNEGESKKDSRPSPQGI